MGDRGGYGAMKGFHSSQCREEKFDDAGKKERFAAMSPWEGETGKVLVPMEGWSQTSTESPSTGIGGKAECMGSKTGSRVDVSHRALLLLITLLMGQGWNDPSVCLHASLRPVREQPCWTASYHHCLEQSLTLNKNMNGSMKQNEWTWILLCKHKKTAKLENLIQVW